jgi:bifunctional DNA-binding transcriptional regulator/antitoxin component of YhaV-PrlF toxin-antitoxin module
MQTLSTDTLELHVAARGLITLPHALREAYGIRPGDRMTLLDLGGVFVLSRRESVVDALADQIAEQMDAAGESLEGMLIAIREERERYAASPDEQAPS